MPKHFKFSIFNIGKLQSIDKPDESEFFKASHFFRQK
jgi:hypothetical protein